LQTLPDDLPVLAQFEKYKTAKRIARFFSGIRLLKI
jgi:hypothetical protein